MHNRAWQIKENSRIGSGIFFNIVVVNNGGNGGDPGILYIIYIYWIIHKMKNILQLDWMIFQYVYKQWEYTSRKLFSAARKQNGYKHKHTDSSTTTTTTNQRSIFFVNYERTTKPNNEYKFCFLLKCWCWCWWHGHMKWFS